MRKTALIVFLTFAAAGLGACLAARRSVVRVPFGVDLKAYRRLAVPPFSDPRGWGRVFAEEVARGLWSLDFDVYTGVQLAGTLSEMKIRPGETLGMHDLIELRRMSHADAIVSGDIDCPTHGGVPHVSVVIQDTADAKTLFSMSFQPESCGTERDVAPIAARVIAAVRGKLAIPAARGEGPF